MVDPGLLEQVIMNLVVNARDAMPNGGTLTIETGVTKADRIDNSHALPAHGFARITVSDTGTGMTDEVKARIFEPFFTTKEVGKGTGLGLSTCYGIVTQAGGRIAVRSVLGRGTSFDVLLPVTLEEPKHDPVDAGPSMSTEPKAHGTVLVAEDQDSVRVLATTILEMEGFHVLDAANGRLALDVAREYGPERIDMLLSDIVMPVMGGIDLARSIRELNPRIGIAFMSGYAGEMVEEATAMTPYFLQKPFRPGALAECIRGGLMNARMRVGAGASPS
jgi:CheY-like chemotaxis protein